MCKHCGYPRSKHITCPGGKSACMSARTGHPTWYEEEKVVSNHLTGTITDELVERCARKRFEFGYPTLTWSAEYESVRHVWRAGTRAALEEAMREPVVLCKNCGKPIVNKAGWAHSETRMFTCYNVCAEPAE